MCRISPNQELWLFGAHDFYWALTCLQQPDPAVCYSVMSLDVEKNTCKHREGEDECWKHSSWLHYSLYWLMIITGSDVWIPFKANIHLTS